MIFFQNLFRGEYFSVELDPKRNLSNVNYHYFHHFPSKPVFPFPFFTFCDTACFAQLTEYNDVGHFSEDNDLESIPMKNTSITPTSQGSSKWGRMQVKRFIMKWNSLFNELLIFDVKKYEVWSQECLIAKTKKTCTYNNGKTKSLQFCPIHDQWIKWIINTSDQTTL